MYKVVKMRANNQLDLFVFFQMFALKVALVVAFMPAFVPVYALQRQGPRFVVEPPNRVDFLNSTGVSISCSAEGNPTPTITWLRQDGVTLVEDVPRLRQVRADGSLVFQPFKAKDYRQDVHSGVYRCVAENVVGSIISREVKVRAAVHQFYETQVYNDFVINGNTAVLRCHLPSFVKEYVSVVAWIRDDGLVIKGDSGGRYSVFPSGALHIRQAGSKTDASHQYYCQTKHRISGEVKRSATSGKLIVTEPHINSPPRITDRQAHILGNQGKKTELPCSAYGFPPPTYRWFRLDAGNRVPVQLGGRIQQVEGTLIFQKTQVRDAGKYVCVVNNSVGEERGETELMVTAPLSVTISPRRVVAEEGQAVDFNCSVTGHPVRSVLWLRNHRPLVVGGRSQLVNKERLRISHVLREDKGMYQCLAVNDWESTQGTAELKLGDDPPVFSFTFAEQTLEPGPSVSLKCAATGNPLPQITWTLDGTNIADNLRVRVGDFVTSDGYVNSFVNVSSLRTEDGGRYQCQATNEVATVFHEARVNVFGRPYVRTMENRTVLGGSTLVLHCPAAGYPIQEIYWEKGGSRLPHSRRQTAFPNGTIVIEKVDRSMDEGKYHCTAINPKGEKASGTTYVMVQVAPSISSFSFPPNLRKGLRITVSCSVLEGDSPITITWLKDGQRILRGETDIVIESSNEFSSTLFVKNVDFRHNGNYTCLASNLAAKTNYTAPMIVNVPPEWRITPTDTAVVTGQTVVIDCQAEGFPQPRIWWENSDGSSPPVYRTIISNSHIHTLENGSLMIREAEEVDSGFYLCQASNGVGTGLSKVIKVNVHVAAHFRSPFHTVTLKTGDTAKLPCRAFGERPINFVWKKEQAPVDTSKPRIQIGVTEVEDGILSEVLIESVERHDSATYTCIGSNAFGEDQRNIQLIVQEAPDVATNIHATEVTSRSISIKWVPPFNGNSPITAYKIEYRGENDSWSSKAKAATTSGSVTLAGSESSFSIRGLKPVTNYQIRISSENALGWSRPSQTVHVSTGEEAPEGPPLSVKASAITSRSVRITWQSPKKEQRNGKLKGYYLGYRIQNSPNPYNYRTIEIGEGFKEEAVISTLRRASKYSIVVQAFNSKGSGPPSDEIVIETLENDPPLAAVLSVEAVTASSIHLQWNAPVGDNPPVSGYLLYSHKKDESWDERQMAAHQTSYTYQNLDCGCVYEFYIVAFNGIGKSKASLTVASRTQGGVSIAPDKDSFIEINSTSILLQLSAWQTNGCPIKYFVIQYKGHSQKEWILVSNNIMPNQKFVLVTDLSPATWYTALVVAHTDAGPTEAEYIFATLTMGGVAPPFTAMDERRSALYRSLGIVVPASCAIVVLFVISVVACVVVMKRRRHDNTPVRECRLREEKSCEGMNMSVLDRKPGSPESGSIPKDQLYYPSPYATSRVLPGSHKHVMEGGESSQSMRRTIGRREHIYEVPYPPPKWEEDEDSYSHIMESSSVPLHPSHNLYQTPRIMPPLPVRPPVEKNPVRLVHATRSPYRHSSLTSEGHSGEESDSEGTTYTFHGGQHAFRSFGDSHELSEAECDRDQRDAFGKGKKVYVPVLDEADFRRLHVT